jgi:Phosphatidylinositol-4-phosphate 5-Kinase
MLCFNHHARKSRLDGSFVEFSLRDRYRLISALKADVDFLQSQNLMDYSLLLAIEQLPKRKPSLESNRRRNT